MNKLLLSASLSVALFANTAWAFEVDSKPITASIPVKSTANALLASQEKTVYLMKIKLTAAERRSLMSHRIPAKLSSKATHDDLPAQVDLGMNNVPVLDQGRHGSCVTFANTAAVDVLIGKGDYISQLCNLTLGNYLSEQGGFPSGWSGSAGSIILNQMQQFGIVSKENEKSKSCGGLNAYPTMSQNEGKPMTLDESKSMREPLANMIYWEDILDFYQAADLDPAHPYNADNTLLQVKRSLAAAAQKNDNHMRITFGTFLPVDYCSAGACGKYHEKNDSWVLSKAIMNDPTSWYNAGHEMVIVGYDDNAVAVDNEGGQHKGMFVLRNSWGADAGDKGNYYMSYDFFKQFATEVQEVMTVPQE